MGAPLYIYFIKPCGMAGPIKIGCSKVPEERLIALTFWAPFKLELLATAPGDYKIERALHSCFADAHSHSEWFHPVPRLLKAIERLQGGEPLERAVDLNDRRGRIGSAHRWPADSRRYMSYVHRLRHARNRAEAQLGDRRSLPRDVDLIVERWGGHRWRAKQPPTSAEIARLEEVICSPEIHCVPWDTKGLTKSAA